MEIELKLALDARLAPRLKRHALLAGNKPRHQRLHTLYLDTPEFDLLARRVAFRLRRVGYHWVQTVKAEARAVGALSSRPEWEVAVAGSGADFAVLPAEALARLAGVDLDRLAPVFETEFQRTTWQVDTRDGRAEVALDRGEVRAGGARKPIAEVEIELKSGSPAGLFELARALLDELPLRVEARGKAERGYQLAEALIPAPLRAVKPGLRPDMPAGQSWLEITRAALVQLSANVPGFLEQAEDIEYLHQLRIALRRLRAVVGLGKSLGQPRPAWSGELGEIMRGLNAARDWDVFLHETLPAVEAVLATQPLGDAFQEQVRRAAARARQEAQALVASPAFTRLVLDIGASLLEDHPQDQPTAQWAAHLLDERWKKLRVLCRKLSSLGPGGRHQARIAAKKLRYAADALAGLYGKRGNGFIKRLADLQDTLGQANDAYVATRLLEELVQDTPALAWDAGRVSGVMSERVGDHGLASDAVWRRMAKAKAFWR